MRKIKHLAAPSVTRLCYSLVYGEYMGDDFHAWTHNSSSFIQLHQASFPNENFGKLVLIFCMRRRKVLPADPASFAVHWAARSLQRCESLRWEENAVLRTAS